jgi:hypothetical protein
MINFNFTKRQSELLPEQDGVINLDIFDADYARGHNTLSEIADGLIFNLLAHIHYSNLKSSDYLPEYCPVGH